MTGFNDTFGIAVRRDLAERYQLRTYSDLARVADKMNFGAEYDFFERDTLQGSRLRFDRRYRHRSQVSGA